MLSPGSFFSLLKKMHLVISSAKQIEALTRMSFKLLAFVNLIIKKKP